MEAQYQLTQEERSQHARLVAEWDRLLDAIRTVQPPPPLLTDEEWEALERVENQPGYAEAMP